MESIECNGGCPCCCGCCDDEAVPLDEETNEFYARAFASFREKYPNKEDWTSRAIDNHLFTEYMRQSTFGPYIGEKQGD